MNKKELDLIAKEPLSYAQVIKIANMNPDVVGRVKAVRYDQLTRLPDPGCAYVILFRQATNYGHFICLINHGRSIESFNSLGAKPDAEYRLNSPELNKQLNQTNRLILALMTDFYINVNPVLTYNDVELQKPNDHNDSSCGRWCGLRLQYLDWNPSKFVRWVDDKRKQLGLTRRQFVVYATL